jgi:branched-chain amino acid transport system ATP-binding protein
MAVLRTEKLSKSFGGLNVLTNVTFSAYEGEKVAIIGPNGAGKSTFFNVLGGQLQASKGRIFLEEREVTKLSPDRRLHLGLARSYQINNLFFTLPLLDNMLLALYGGERSHVHVLRSLYARRGYAGEAQRMLELMELWDKRFETVAALSYGDQRLVEIALTLACKPRVVLLDEPTAGLPTSEALTFAAKIRELTTDTTLVFCAHDMDLVFNLADRIAVLYFGEILCEGTPGEISCNAKVQEIYLGTGSEGATGNA